MRGDREQIRSGRRTMDTAGADRDRISGRRRNREATQADILRRWLNGDVPREAELRARPRYLTGVIVMIVVSTYLYVFSQYSDFLFETVKPSQVWVSVVISAILGILVPVQWLWQTVFTKWNTIRLRPGYIEVNTLRGPKTLSWPRTGPFGIKKKYVFKFVFAGRKGRLSHQIDLIPQNYRVDAELLRDGLNAFRDNALRPR